MSDPIALAALFVFGVLFGALGMDIACSNKMRCLEAQIRELRLVDYHEFPPLSPEPSRHMRRRKSRRNPGSTEPSFVESGVIRVICENCQSELAAEIRDQRRKA